MGEKLPIVSAEEMVKFLQHHGFVRERQKGSHIVLVKPGVRRPAVVPAQKEQSRGAILKNLKTADVSREDFICFFRKH